MNKSVEHLFQPNRLKILWQNVRDDADRRNYHVADLLREGDQVTLDFCINSSDFKDAKNAGFESISKFTLEQASYNDGVADTFFRRLPPPNRGDYLNYLKGFGLERFPDVDKFSLLGHTGALLPGDPLHFTFYYEDMPSPVEFVMAINGFRHTIGEYDSETSSSLMNICQSEKQLSLQLEPQNLYDPNAIAVYSQDKKLGYINRNSTEQFKKWMEKQRIELHTFRMNGTPSRPRLLVFAQVL